MKKENKECIACTIQERDEQVKQMPRHTCGIDGPNPDLKELRSEYKTPVVSTDQNEKYNAKVREISELLIDTVDITVPWETPYSVDYEKAARAMVAEIEKFTKEALYHNAPDRNPLFVNKYLIERGLIPSPENNNNNG